MNRQPWYCMGTEENPHLESENWEENCSFPGCQEKHRQIPYGVLGLTAGLACLGILAFFAFQPTPTPRRFTYGGATAFAPIRSRENEKLIEKAISRKISGFDLVYLDVTDDKPGSGAGIKMLIEGQISLAHSSRPLRDEEVEKAKKRGFSLKQIPVALDGIAVYVNPDLNISNLTLDQVRGLFTGRIRNWKMLGGPTLRVTPISLSNEGKDTTDFFQRDVMGGQSFASNLRDARDPTNAIREVSAIPGGIGYASAPLVCDQKTIKPVDLAKKVGESYLKPCTDNQPNIAAFDGSYPITRRLFVIYREDESDDAEAGEAYANMLQSKEGQELLKEAGFQVIK